MVVVWSRQCVFNSNEMGCAIDSAVACHAKQPGVELPTRHFLVVFPTHKILVGVGIVNRTLDCPRLSSSLVSVVAVWICQCVFGSNEMSCAIGSAVACHAIGPGFEPQTRHCCRIVGFYPV